MVSDRRTVNLLEKDHTATPLFENTEETLKELEYLTDVGYLVKRNTEIIRIEYQYVLYSSYPVILPIGDFQLSGNVYPIAEAVMITNDRFKRICKRMEEFRKNVNSGIYHNILDFNYTINKKFYSIIYEVKDRYFDSLFFSKRVLNMNYGLVRL